MAEKNEGPMDEEWVLSRTFFFWNPEPWTLNPEKGPRNGRSNPIILSLQSLLFNRMVEAYLDEHTLCVVTKLVCPKKQ
jgi:hypothetical protein